MWQMVLFSDCAVIRMFQTVRAVYIISMFLFLLFFSWFSFLSEFSYPPWQSNDTALKFVINFFLST